MIVNRRHFPAARKMFHFKNVWCYLFFDSVGKKKNTKVVALNAFCELTNKQEKTNYNNHLFFIQ